MMPDVARSDLRDPSAQLRRSLWTALPGRVQSFDPSKQSADIEPLVHDTWEAEDGTSQTGPLPRDPFGARLLPRFRRVASDLSRIQRRHRAPHLLRRSIDRWLSEGGSVDPQDDRTHDLIGCRVRSRPHGLRPPDRPVQNGPDDHREGRRDSDPPQAQRDAGRNRRRIPARLGAHRYPAQDVPDQPPHGAEHSNLPVSGATGPPAPGTFPVLPTILRPPSRSRSNMATRLDLLLDDNGVVLRNGDWAFAIDREGIQQRISQVLKTIAGEWFLDLDSRLCPTSSRS